MSIKPEPYQRSVSGIFVADPPITHRGDDYQEEGFPALLEMQQRHFWYRGRHRFIRKALLSTFSPRDFNSRARLIDLGGGCGGWARTLLDRPPGFITELALGDSSMRALELAGPLLNGVERFQIDLYDLRWRERWEGIFLLDVIEHLEDDARALDQARQALVPGGLLYVAVPALKAFWSYNDEIALHKRRYSREDLGSLARRCGLELVRTRYFMFFLSPLLFLSRLRSPPLGAMSAEQVRQHMESTHAVPGPLVNGTLSWIFGAETPLGWWIPFPLGTSVLGVFRRPR